MIEDIKCKNMENGTIRDPTKKVNEKFGIRHLQAFLLFLGMVSAFNTRSSMSVALIAMINEEVLPVDKFGLVSTGFIIGLVIMEIPFGYLVMLRSPKTIHSVFMLLSGIMHMLVPYAAIYGGWITVLTVRILMGVCQGGLMSCTQALLSKWCPPFERARLAMFVFNGAILGNMIAMLVSGALLKSNFGWSSIFYLFGAMTSVWGAVFYVFGADSPAQHPKINKDEREYIESSIGESTDESKVTKVPLRQILTSVPVWSLVATNCGDVWGFFILLTLLPNYMSNIVGFNIEEGAIISALPYLSAWLLAFPYSWMSDYFLKRGVPVTLVRKISNSIAMWIPGLALALLCVVERSKVVTVGIMVVAVSFSCGTFCSYQVSKMEISPNYAGIIMSFTNFFGNVMGVLGPNVYSFVVEDVKNPQQWDVIFLITASLYIVSNAIFVVFGTSKKQPWNEIENT
ncbi:putative inorganic phosphate cotransporter [Copidosoma floridanum]|uniref:putative inorganic phosphate cotransporter n=1 Tax=Copidosoma floridanum TaxID=29053 RepID=UPI0006C9A040|nr:putative inorganic phosphate cotransporter [Copidosoma floridanum]